MAIIFRLSGVYRAGARLTVNGLVAVYVHTYNSTGIEKEVDLPPATFARRYVSAAA